jgi:glyoxylase-like metal-dependent hydrolase (beta-lactamase superfamily II)
VQAVRIVAVHFLLIAQQGPIRDDHDQTPPYHCRRSRDCARRLRLRYFERPAPAPQPATTGSHAAGKTEVLWLGQAATRITTPGGKVIVIDPWLTGNPKTPPAFKQLSALGKVDMILLTHAHGDHLGMRRQSPRRSTCRSGMAAAWARNWSALVW